MHDAIKDMLQRYQCKSTLDYTRALREIIQKITLVGLWRAKFFEKTAFYGGTALRIFYGLDRFSEDLDFSLLQPDKDFSLEPYNQSVKAELIAFGFEVSVEKKLKYQDRKVESAFIKTNTMQELLKIGVPAINYKGLHPQTLMRIKFEVDIDPPQGFSLESKILNDPVPVAIKTYVPSDLFAGKMHALLCQLWNERIKGRDWYDFVWYVRKEIPLNLEHLQKRMHQTGHLHKGEVLTKELFLQFLHEKIANLKVEKAMLDVRPFIQDEAQIASWSPAYFLQFADQIKYHLPSIAQRKPV